MSGCETWEKRTVSTQCDCCLQVKCMRSDWPRAEARTVTSFNGETQLLQVALSRRIKLSFFNALPFALYFPYGPEDFSTISSEVGSTSSLSW